MSFPTPGKDMLDISLGALMVSTTKSLPENTGVYARKGSRINFE
jgi:hypothetical protein